MKVVDVLAMVLVIIGGLNWGLVGLFDFDLVSTIFGVGTLLTRLVYCLVGLSALYKICMCQKIHDRCCKK